MFCELPGRNTGPILEEEFGKPRGNTHETYPGYPGRSESSGIFVKIRAIVLREEASCTLFAKRVEADAGN
jgi:hypothetical protein